MKKVERTMRHKATVISEEIRRRKPEWRGEPHPEEPGAFHGPKFRVIHRGNQITVWCPDDGVAVVEEILDGHDPDELSEAEKIQKRIEESEEHVKMMAEDHPNRPIVWGDFVHLLRAIGKVDDV